MGGGAGGGRPRQSRHPGRIPPRAPRRATHRADTLRRITAATSKHLSGRGSTPRHCFHVGGDGGSPTPIPGLRSPLPACPCRHIRGLSEVDRGTLRRQQKVGGGRWRISGRSSPVHRQLACGTHEEPETSTGGGGQAEKGISGGGPTRRGNPGGTREGQIAASSRRTGAP